MRILVPVTLFGWIPVVLALFMLVPPRRAVIVAFLLAWLFLPVAHYRIEGFPDYNKVSATSVGILLGVMLFDCDRLLAFRPRVFDVPMAVWCFCPIASSLTNQLGLYDGLTSAFNEFIIYGIPYLIGRIYFSDLTGLRELAAAIFIGGLLYIPFCLYEIRMSPQLHRMIYGYHTHSFHGTFRFGGWRPTVFMIHGLAVGMWMTASSIAGLWLWWTGSLKQLWGIPTTFLVAALLITTVLCKSLNGLVLLVIGSAVLFVIKQFRTSLPLVLITLSIPMYVAIRVPGLWSGEQLIRLISVIDEDRAASLEFRLVNENLLAAKARLRPAFGWGGWGRSRVFDEQGRDISVTDSQWIISFGTKGLVGLASFMAAALVPVILLRGRLPVRTWGHGAMAPALGLALVIVLVMIDNLVNSMYNPMFIVVIGALTVLKLPRLPLIALMAKQHLARLASPGAPRAGL